MRRYILPLLMLLAVQVTAQAQKTSDHNFEVAKHLDIFNHVYKNLELLYVDTLKPKETIGTGITAMLRSLDPYTEYYAQDETKDLRMMLTGKYAGIGALIRKHQKLDRVVIDEPYANMPAAEAGLKKGDVILSIDDSMMTTKPVVYVSDHLRGDAGTHLKVTVRRPGVEDSIDVDMERKVIALPSVPYYGMWKGYGYIMLESFTENCSHNVMEALVGLKEQGAKGIILDLRGNGGGLLQEAVDIVGLFVPKGTKLVETRGKIPQAESTYVTKRNPIDEKIPLVVLTDDQSASASEIVAGSLQDLDRAVIVGTRTFGKGLVQSTRVLPFNGTLKVTTAKYYIPSGRCIQEIDYSKRNEKGQAQHIPDSLTNVFYTAAGRPVRDGGGIRPDVECKLDTMPDLLYSLSQSVVLFDFVNDWCSKHPTIAPMGQFKLSDDDYNAFKEFVSASDFKYVSNSSKALESLVKIARAEKLADKAKDELDALAVKLQYDLKTDLDVFRSSLEKLIAIEIVVRYYYQRGAVVQNLESDKCLAEAVGVLDDMGRYKSILASPSSDN